MSDDAVELDPSIGSALLKMPSKANFALVIFRGIEDSYIVGTNVDCRYTVSGRMETHSKDWVGLYKVGWRNQSDYVYYDWSPASPSGTPSGADYTVNIVFPASHLPRDDGEFYQFCYVTHSGHVRGASTPFQFKEQSIDDLIEIEDENGELLIIKTKTAVLEDQLKKANETRVQLKQEIQILENEKDMLKRSEAELLKKLARQREMNDMADAKIREMMDMITDGSQQNDHLQDCINSLQEKIEIINQEKLSMEKRVDDSDRYIISLQDKIKTLVNEKDALTGRVKSLEEEKELYKGHFTSSEDTLQSYVQECEKMKLQMLTEQTNKSKLKKDMERLEVELMEESKKTDALKKAAQSEKENMEYLNERLRNAEDKLCAAEHCKVMLNEEVLTLKVAYEKISTDLESSRVIIDELTALENATVSQMTADKECMREKIKELNEKLQASQDEVAVLKEDVLKLKAQLQEKSSMDKAEADGPLYALQMAQVTLKERYAKLGKKNEELHKSLEQAMIRMSELTSADDDHQQEIRSLRERLIMGQEAYKEKYIEWELLETELYKMKLNKKSPAYSKESSPISAAPPSLPLRAGCEGEACGKGTSDQPCEDGLETLSKTEVQQQLKDLSIELERRFAKARKYKHLYEEQRGRNSAVSAMLEEKDKEIMRLNDIIQFEKTQKNSKFDPMSNDSEEHSSVLIAPLKPLPAPIQPERLHSSRIPSIKLNSVSDVGLNVVSEMIGSMEMITSPSTPPSSLTTARILPACSDSTVFVANDVAVSVASDGAAANVIGEEERFVDALSDPQDSTYTKMCPVCQLMCSVKDIVDHVSQHQVSGWICPVCAEMFDDKSTVKEFFETHVNSHFQD